MTDILLVRHGQASFGGENYDCLTELGRHQAKALGPYLRQCAWLPGQAAISGEHHRQRETAKLCLEHGDCPLTITITPAFNEYNHKAMLATWAGGHEQTAGDLARQGDVKGFQSRLDEALRGWAGAGDSADCETWNQYNQRVLEGLHECVRAADKRDVILVFTSAGVVASAVCQCLTLGIEGFIALNRRVTNASVTHLGYGRNGFSLQGFNDASAMRMTSLEFLTYR